MTMQALSHRSTSRRASLALLGGLVLAGLVAAPTRALAFDIRLGCPGNINAECLSEVPPAATTVDEFIAQGGSLFSDCPDDVRWSFVGEIANGSCPLEITRTYMLTDGCGESTTCEQLITVWDTTDPIIGACPDGGTLECGVAVKVRMDATDNCDTDLEYSASVIGGTGGSNVSIGNNGGGSFTITINGTADVEILFTVKDDCGNTAECKASYRATCVVFQGCTPGYWKNHTKKWDSAGDPVAAAAGFITGTSFNAFFGVTAAQSTFPDGTSMLKALGTGGGTGNNNANLARHAVAALLSIGAGLEYHFPAGITDAAGLVAAVHNAYVTGNFGTLAGDLAAGNEAGCPLN